MGVFGSGGGPLGLGGTKWDPNTWGGLDLDLDLHPSDITVTDPTANWPDPRPYQPGGGILTFDPDLPDDPIGDISDTLGDTFGDDPVGDLQGDIETWWDENTDTFNDMGDKWDEGVADANIFVGNTVGVLGDAGSLIKEGFDATVNTNNPNSLISSPVNWYEEAAGVGKGGWDPMFGTDEANAFAWGVFGQALEGVNFGGGSAATGTGTGLDSGEYEGLQGDPFGREGKERREIHMQRKFPQQVATAPSLVNQTRNLS